MRSCVMIMVLVVLAVSGCTSYEACKGDCAEIHASLRNNVTDGCIDDMSEKHVIRFGDKVYCNSMGIKAVSELCYEECRGV